MEMDKAIRVTNVSHKPFFPKVGAPVDRLCYEFFVGDNGPFYEHFLANEQHEDAINRRLAEKAKLLRATGALPTPESGT